MTLSAVLVRELAAARTRLNAQVAAARRARTGFDVETLNEAVRERIDPLAVAVEAIAPARTAALVDAAFTLTVALTDHALTGARRVLVDRTWTHAAVPLAAAVAERPQAALAMLTNAVLTLFATRGARPDEWIARMAALAPWVTADTLGAAGQVVAWRSGMAHYRQDALALADALPEPLALGRSARADRGVTCARHSPPTAGGLPNPAAMGEFVSAASLVRRAVRIAARGTGERAGICRACRAQGRAPHRRCVWRDAASGDRG